MSIKNLLPSEEDIKALRDEIQINNEFKGVQVKQYINSLTDSKVGKLYEDIMGGVILILEEPEMSEDNLEYLLDLEKDLYRLLSSPKKAPEETA